MSMLRERQSQGIMGEVDMEDTGVTVEDTEEAMVVTMEKDQLNLDMVVMEVVVVMVAAIALMVEVMDMVEAIALMEGDAVAMEEDMGEATMAREMLKLNLDMGAMGMVVMEVEVDMVEVMVDMVEGMEEDIGADILQYMSTLTADDNFVIFAIYTRVACLDLLLFTQ